MYHEIFVIENLYPNQHDQHGLMSITQTDDGRISTKFISICKTEFKRQVRHGSFPVIRTTDEFHKRVMELYDDYIAEIMERINSRVIEPVPSLKLVQ